MHSHNRFHRFPVVLLLLVGCMLTLPAFADAVAGTEPYEEVVSKPIGSFFGNIFNILLIGLIGLLCLLHVITRHIAVFVLILIYCCTHLLLSMLFRLYSPGTAVYLAFPALLLGLVTFLRLKDPQNNKTPYAGLGATAGLLVCTLHCGISGFMNNTLINYMHIPLMLLLAPLIYVLFGLFNRRNNAADMKRMAWSMGIIIGLFYLVAILIEGKGSFIRYINHKHSSDPQVELLWVYQFISGLLAVALLPLLHSLLTYNGFWKNKPETPETVTGSDFHGDTGKQ